MPATLIRKPPSSSQHKPIAARSCHHKMQESASRKQQPHKRGRRRIHDTSIATTPAMSLCLLKTLWALCSTLLLVHHTCLASSFGPANQNGQHQPQIIQASFLTPSQQINITHVTYDPFHDTVYLGATNNLYQLNGSDLSLQYEQSTGPVNDNPSCGITECHGYEDYMKPTPNVNKILVIDYQHQKLLSCGSTKQGACRRHQLNNIAQQEDLIPQAVAANDDNSSTIAFIGPSRYIFESANGLVQQQQQQVLYVASTYTKASQMRDLLVPAIGTRMLDDGENLLKLYENTFVDSARIDINSHLRDYFLVNYLYAFASSNYIYFVTVQKKATSRDYEELGYHTRLARICITDSSYNSYTEVDLKCMPSANNRGSSSKQFGGSSAERSRTTAAPAIEEYPLLQDAILVDAGSQLLQSLNAQSTGDQANQPAGFFFSGGNNNYNSSPNGASGEPSSPDDSKVLLGVFTSARDHTHHPGEHSALCAFSLTEIEEKFNDNIHNCYTGKMQSRNMEYIAGNVQECPKSGQGGNVVNFCLETLKINGSIPITSQASIQYSNTTLTAITATSHVNSPLKNIYSDQLTSDLASFNATLAATASGASTPISSGGASQQQQQHTVVFMGTSNGHIKKVLLNNASNALEFEDLQVDTNPILADLHLHSSGKQLIAATPYKIMKLPTHNCAQYSNCRECSQSRNPYCGWCSLKRSCTTKSECPSSGSFGLPLEPQKSDANRVLAAQTNKQQLKWISSDSAGKCIDLVSILPDKVPITGTGKIDLHIERLPRLPKDHSYKCIFDRKEQTVATQTTHGLSCSLPKVMHRPKIQPGRDHALVDLTVRSSETNTDFLDGKITFFECQLHTTCKDCLSANWGCNWCLNENICLFNTSKCEKTGPQQTRQLESILLPGGQVQPLVIGGGQRAAGSGALIQQQQRSAGNTINQVSQCPTFDVGHQQDILIAAGTERELTIKVKNIPQFKGNVECIVEVENTRTILRGRIGEDRVICENSTYHYRADVGLLSGQLIVSYSDTNIFIDKTNFTLYKCHLLGSYLNRPDCSLCQRLSPALNCGWCGGSCQVKSQCSQRLEDTCPPPRIDFVSPLKGPINGGTRLTIEGSNLGQSYEEIVNRVSVGNVPCRPIEEEYRPSNKIVCIVGPLVQTQAKRPLFELDDVVSFGDVTVGNKAGYTIGPSFQFKSIYLRDHQPKYGPQSGGTRVTLSGFNLNIGSSVQVFLDELACQVEIGSVSSEQLVCITSASRHPSRTIKQLKLIIDDAQVVRDEDTFYYTQDPTITRISPLKSYTSGGKPINVYGTNLTSVQHPRMAILDIVTGKKLNESLCLLHDDSRMQCPSPAATNLAPLATMELDQQQIATTAESTGASTTTREQQADSTYAHLSTDEPVKFRVSFIMDNVLKLSDLQTYQPTLNSEIVYTADPKLYPFSSDQYKTLQAIDVQQSLANGQIIANADDQQQNFLIEPDTYLAEPLDPKLILFGENLRLAVADYEITISIGTDICNLTQFTPTKLVCAIPLNHIAPPVDEEGRETQRALPLVVVRIGFNLRFEIGYMQYHPRLLEQIMQTSEQALQRPIYPHYMPRENESFFKKIVGFFTTLLMLATYALLAGVLVTLVYRYRGCRQPNVISRVDSIERSVKVECQLAYMSLQSDLSELVNHVELSGVPVLNTKRFIMKVFFPGINNHPLLKTSGIQYPLKMTVDPMEQFERLILTKPFLITFINTLEAQPSFTIRDKVNVASLIMIALMDRLDYATDILKTLLFQLVARSVSRSYSNTLHSVGGLTRNRKRSALSKVVGGSASNLFNSTTSAAQLFLSRVGNKTSPCQQQHNAETYRHNISTTTFLENRIPTLSHKSQLQEMNNYSSERLMLRRTDTVVEKMLTNWLALNMYGHFHGEAGQSLYMLFEALRCQMERGPVEAQTGNAYYSLSESKLLREPYIQFNHVNLYVIVDTSIMNNTTRGYNNNQTLLIDSDTSPYYLDDPLRCGSQSRPTNTITLSLRVIDCDTISQVKRKILNALYRNSPHSTRLSVDDVLLSLRQHQMMGGQCTMSSGAQYVTINLYDEDFTSVVALNGMKRINTIRHYGVSEHAIMTLNRYQQPPKVCQSTTRTNLTEMLDEHYNNPYSEIQYGPLKQQQQQFYHPSSSSTSSTGNVMDTHSTSADSSVNATHLLARSYQVKEEQPIYYQIGSATTSSKSEQSLQQIYLSRMMMSKGTVQSYIDNFFKTILKHPEGSCGSPAVKWLFDLLDEAALENGIVDEDVVFSWKSNAFLLRFWANLVKNPNYILDVDKTTTLDASLSAIAQTLIDSCSVEDQKLSMDSSSHRLLFAKDVPRYRALVKRFYQDIASVRPISDLDMSNHMKSLFNNGQNSTTLNFDKRLALKELCVYAANYGVDLMSSISANITCQQLDLASELKQCFRSFNQH